MQSHSHCNMATNPQPSKPNHAIIADKIKAVSEYIAIFLLGCAAAGRDRPG